MLHRFWFEFANVATSSLPPGVGLGCGVTAYDYEDAIRLMKERLFSNGAIPAVARAVTDVNLNDLEKGHVAPNIGNPVARGIWFPQGY